MCTSFRSSPSLCNALAFVARRLCTSYVHPSGLTALVASRLIALDKCPGVRPIGIGETSRRIISKAILSLFNSLNREVALRNSLHLCPSLGRVLTNIYREGACLYIDGEVIRSAEGTTQGDPMAMAMYAVGISPLIQRLTTINDTRQIWYADDCTGCGTLQDLSQWWLSLSEIGSQYGYFPNASKSILLVKEEHQERAQHLFRNCNISIVTEGACVLGSPIGTSEYVNNWMDNKVQSWVDEITTLSTIVRTQPQSAFSALTHGIMSHWTYILRTCPDISTHLIPLGNTLRTVFIPALTSQGPPNDLMRDLFSLPFRLGGLGIPNPSLLSNEQYANSLSVTAPSV